MEGRKKGKKKGKKEGRKEIKWRKAGKQRRGHMTTYNKYEKCFIKYHNGCWHMFEPKQLTPEAIELEHK